MLTRDQYVRLRAVMDAYYLEQKGIDYRVMGKSEWHGPHFYATPYGAEFQWASQREYRIRGTATNAVLY